MSGNKEEYVIRPTTVWGDIYKVRNVGRLRRLNKKRDIFQSRIIDHPKLYALKPKNQRGPAREEQTFLIAYNYVPISSHNPKDPEDEITNLLKTCGLTFYESECIFRGHKAYRVLIMDSEASLEKILEIEDQIDKE